MFVSRGFTIIELLVVIAIITILPVIILSNFPQVKLQFALNRAAYTFAQDVRQAQDLALSSASYKDSFGINQRVAGYGVYIDISRLGDKKYLLYADGMPGNNQYDVSDAVTRIIDISTSEQGVILKEIRNIFGTKTSIDFASSSANVAISQLDKHSAAVEIIFALESDMAKTKSVLIHTSGLIEIK